MSYKKYSDAMVAHYGEKVYKIPVNLPITCPNRDGTLGTGGCIFCGEVGAGFEAQPAHLMVKDQIQRNIMNIEKKYNAHLFVAYFQNYTNTYMALDLFKKVLAEACAENVVGLSISTRPDCISVPYLEALKSIKTQYHVAIEIELGLQSININTLKKINRGHGLADYIQAVNQIKAYGFSICTHLIGNLPWDTEDDFYEAARMLNVLEIDAVKVHSLYVLKNTVLGDWYESHAFQMIDADTYLERLIHFIRLLNPEIVIQRLFGRAPEELTLFCNWGMSWRKLQNRLEQHMQTNGYKQGDLYSRGGIL